MVRLERSHARARARPAAPRTKAAASHEPPAFRRPIPLEARHRDAILGVLQDPPEGLNELRGTLILDWEQRNPGAS